MRAALRCGVMLGLVAAFALPAKAQNTPSPTELRLSTALGPAYAQGKAGEVWAALIRERSAGRLAAKHFPGAALIQRDPVREFAAVRDGRIELAVGSTLMWSTQVPELNLFSLPWLVADDAALQALLADDVGRRLSARLEAWDVVPLAWVANGFSALATRTAVRKPADVAGLKTRIQSSPLAVDLLAALGAEASAMGAVDARDAFASGALDGQEVSIAAYAASRLDTAGLTHLLLWDARADALVFVANRAQWDAWGEADRTLVRQAARDAAREAGEFARHTGESATLAALARQGVNITRLTPAGKEAFRVAAQPVFERWAAVVGAELVRAAETAVAQGAASPKQ